MSTEEGAILEYVYEGEHAGVYECRWRNGAGRLGTVHDDSEYDLHHHRNLGVPVTLTGGNGTAWGWAQNFQGDIGAGFTDQPDLTSLITSNGAGTWESGQILTGTSPAFGYYRNASGRTDFNFASTDARSLSGLNAQGVGIIISGVPTGGGASPTQLNRDSYSNTYSPQRQLPPPRRRRQRRPPR